MGLWDLYQELEIRQTKADQRMADEAHGSRIARAQRGVEAVEDRFEKLLLMTEAVWELLSERAGVTDADLLAKLQEIDARDGTVDGRRAGMVQRCESCHAAIEKGRATCLFCGHPAPKLVAFDAV